MANLTEIGDRVEQALPGLLAEHEVAGAPPGPATDAHRRRRRAACHYAGASEIPEAKR